MKIIKFGFLTLCVVGIILLVLGTEKDEWITTGLYATLAAVTVVVALFTYIFFLLDDEDQGYSKKLFVE